MSHPPGAPDPDAARDPWAAPPAYGPTPPYPYPVPRTNGKAQAALWTGLAMLLTSLCGVGLLGFVPITLGILARREIHRSGGQQGGAGMALAGIITGAVALVVSLVVVGLVVLVFATYDSGSSSYGTTGV